ncbi:flagellar biosynthesis protein FlhB [bacterium 1xD42-62]|uniref:Flagellar biosynthetic protein FlhB n=1 Tax=Parablautia muri TaxID=2320879 RepID=A0A9X5BGQ0_9FIRM|nr:flagellar biosynthesis protein FlhB [Parablautia muri]NBJ93498.1 flagellar biosynthesis protein FlhB [Parablautia muri]
MLSYNLQFFAKDGPGGEKTEEPTAKKLSDARGEGQVAKSKEIANAFGMLALFIILKLYLGTIGTRFIEYFNVVYGQMPDAIKRYEGQTPIAALQVIIRSMMVQLLLLILPILLIGFVVAFICDLMQVKWRPTTKPMRPKLSKLSPLKGFKRIFSANSLMELFKSILKLLVIGYMAYSYLKGRLGQIFILYDITLNRAIGLIGEIVIDLGIRIAAVYMVIAFLDYAYQKWKFHEDMKMTKQEVKDEFKNAEGDPQIKGKQKQRMREASMRRMMQQLPEADVVITNPTHYAVAIKYDPDKYDAPYVLAKGEDYLALKIKEAAKENNVEIVENKPLARMLYANVDVGGLVPPELYQAVAEVLAFVYHLKGKI